MKGDDGANPPPQERGQTNGRSKSVSAANVSPQFPALVLDVRLRASTDKSRVEEANEVKAEQLFYPAPTGTLLFRFAILLFGCIRLRRILCLAPCVL